jgi:hypothetical protein
MRAGIWRSVAIWTLFVLLALALYRPVLPEPLYNDDWVLLRVTPRDLLRPFFAGLYYRPVVVASALLNRALFGDGPLGFNLVNLALHVLVSLLVVRVGRALRGGGGSATLLAGLAFLLHPAAVGATAWVVGRGDLLVALFFLSGCRFLARGSTRCSGPLLGAVALLAMLSKETGYAVPFALLLLAPDMAPASREMHKRRRDAFWLLGALVLAIVVRLLVFSRGAPGDALGALGGGRSLGNGIRDLVRYAVWLCGGGVVERALALPPLGAHWGLELLLALAISALLLWWRETRRIWLAGGLFLAPALRLTPQARCAYLPLVCLALTASLLLTRLRRVMPRRVGGRVLRAVELLLVLCLLAGLSRQARRSVENWALLRHANAHVSGLLRDLGGQWASPASLFVFGLGQEIPFRGRTFVARSEGLALSGMLRREVLWLDDLDRSAARPGLRVFVLRGARIHEIPRALEKLERYWSRRLPRRRDVEPTLISESGTATVFRLAEPVSRYPYLQLEFATHADLEREGPLAVVIRWRDSPTALWALQRQTLIRAREVRPGIYSADLALGALCAVQGVGCREVMVDLSLARAARPGRPRLRQTTRRDRERLQGITGALRTPR